MVWNKGPVRICKRGHDKDVLGRGKDGRCLPCRKARINRWTKFNRYGVNQNLYDEMLSLQKGKCAICENAPEEKRALNIDHDHLSGKVRGLLCKNCNFILGLAKDNKVTLLKAAEYLA